MICMWEPRVTRMTCIGEEGQRGSIIKAYSTCIQHTSRYLEAGWWMVQGHYPVIMEDAAQMAALQTHAEYGPTLLDDLEGLEGAIERFITKQVPPAPPALPRGTSCRSAAHSATSGSQGMHPAMLGQDAERSDCQA